MEWIFLIAAGLLEVTWDCRIAAARKELNTTGRFLFFDVYTLPSSDASRHTDFSEKHDTSPVASQCGIWTGFRDGHYKCGVTLALTVTGAPPCHAAL